MLLREKEIANAFHPETEILLNMFAGILPRNSALSSPCPHVSLYLPSLEFEVKPKIEQ
jgi:hypothetical protein